MRKIISNLMRIILGPLLRKYDRLLSEIENNRILIAQSLISNLKNNTSIQKLSDAEFRVFSQWGEDGIIQYLLTKIPIQNEIFVEIGVEDYSESNTRFLLINNNWKGLIIDCDNQNITKIRSKDYFWRNDLQAICAFVTQESVNQILQQSGITGDIGLLSIDVDGNDYWIWKAIKDISPRIVIIEYNSVFGNQYSVTVPYHENFSRSSVHYSNLYFGASLPALCMLGDEKGYVFIGTNSAGINAFFVRRDLAEQLGEIVKEACYVESKIRESRNQRGKLTYLSGIDRLTEISNNEVLDLESNTKIKIRALLH